MNIVMSMPAKRAPVYIKDKNGEVVFVYTLNNLLDVFSSYKDVSKVRDEDGKVLPDSVEFRIEGIVDGMQLSSHRINLTGHTLVSSPEGAEGGEGGGERDGGEATPTDTSQRIREES